MLRSTLRFVSRGVWLFLAVVILTVYTSDMVSAGKNPISWSNVSSKVKLNVNESIKLKVKYSKAKYKKAGVKWKSSNKKVAKVNSKGKVTAIAPGKAVITCTMKAAPKKKIKCTIKVKAVKNVIKDVPLQSPINRTDTKFIAHRGLSALAPENSIAAFKLAAQYGFYGIETDIQETADGQFVLMHDSNLYRMCGLEGTVSLMPLIEIRQAKLIAGSNIDSYSKEPQNTVVPTLYEYLDICRAYGIVPVMEIKFACTKDAVESNPLYKLYVDVRRFMGDRKVMFSSFGLDTVKSMRSFSQNDPNTEVTLLANSARILSNDNLDYLKKHSIDLSVNHLLDPALLSKAASFGFATNYWTVDSRDKARELIGAGAQYITTNTVLWDN